MIALVALGLGASACKKSDDKKSDQSSDKTADKTPADDKPAVAMAGNAGGSTAAAGDDLSLLPVDSEVVMGINFAQLQQSGLWKQFAPVVMAKIASKLADFKAACGFDPFEAFKSISIGMKGLGPGTQPEGAIVIHGPDKAKVMSCVLKAKTEAASKGEDLTVDGDVFMVKDKTGNTSAFTFVNDSTLLGVIGPAASAATAKEAAKGGSALKSSSTFVEMYSKIDTSQSMWILINGNSPMMSKAGMMGVKLKAIFGSVNLTDGLTVDMRVRLGSPDEATQLVGMAKGQINNPQVKEMFDKLDVTSDGADVKVSVAMSNQKLQQLVTMMGSMIGGLMGGMGGGGASLGGP
ncbi:MAG TPA: hypothetical protein VLX92_30050 [Kofleriaceae bacterium]|nr:hypothetical protein [Kofleriaceae bacterium]